MLTQAENPLNTMGEQSLLEVRRVAARDIQQRMQQYKAMTSTEDKEAAMPLLERLGNMFDDATSAMLRHHDGGPAAWVGCLACYNDGNLRGLWVSGYLADEVTVDDCHGWQTVADAYPHEELWVFDHQGYDDLLEGECDPMQATELANKWDDIERALRDVSDRGAFDAWRELMRYDMEEAVGKLDEFEMAYQGTHRSPADWAHDYLDDAYNFSEMPSVVISNVDWDDVAEDLRHDGYCYMDAPGGQVYVFEGE